MEVWDGDEISNFLITSTHDTSARQKGFGGCLSYEMHKRSHTIVRLPVHLENQQTVYFAPGQAEQRVHDNVQRRTKLTEFFSLNAHDVEARQRWTRRRRRMGNDTLAQMYVVNPLDRDRFHLRLLLFHKRGPQSFRDMRTVDRVVYESYAAAAVAMGLIESDRAWLACMDESASFDTLRQLRYLFVTILVMYHPAEPLALYQASEDNMMEDFNRRFQDGGKSACLGDLLRAHGKTFAEYGLPNPDVALLEPEPDDQLFGTIDAATLWARRVNDLNDEQRTMYDRVMAAVDDNRNVQKVFYVDGPRETGKPTLYGCLIWSLRNRRRSVLCVAFTGIAASLMNGGMTVHSTFGLPFGTLNDDETSSITMQSKRAQRIRDAALIVWDEVPMSPGPQLAVVDRLLRDIMGSESPFGGKPVLFAGDFRHILPVVCRGSRTAIVMSSIKHNSLWQNSEKFELTRNMRAGNDADFADWLLLLGSGQLPTVDGVLDTVEIPREMVCDVVDLIDFVYPQHMSLANERGMQQINRTVLQRIERTYTAIDTVVIDDPDEEANYPTEFLNSLELNGMPPFKLTLTVGAIVMLLRNLDPKRNLCNGTRLVVTELRRHNFRARVLVDGDGSAQDDVIIPAIPMTTGDEDDLPLKIKRIQFPVRLSFAMTINKSQGQTFDRVGLLLLSPVFTHGQLYVAFSRVRNTQSVKVGMYDDGNGRFVTKNIVYREVLLTR
ncbi:hypothetical protein AGLY_005124 [Aphis glycines]|uniref:ATP-dependent DNA helicase n=1 Tax=Aphis glycines TaxID=307491 RepID=A0A6G0TVW6_APHGL|nr:hypothetical protein AGLY_005124 [Aphis glycines]